MKKNKRLTKKERKALAPDAPQAHQQRHIHCIACGRHIDSGEFTAAPSTARYISCRHGGKFTVCTSCVAEGQRRLDEHDRTGQPVQVAQAWH